MILDKTQFEIENEYYYIDLPEVLKKKNQIRAKELLDHLHLEVFPHSTDKKFRREVLSSITKSLPKTQEKYKSADEQYEELKRKMQMKL